MRAEDAPTFAEQHMLGIDGLTAERLAAIIQAALEKLSIANNDTFPILDSEDGYKLKRLKWQVIIDLLDTLFQPLNQNLTDIAALADPNADVLLFWDDSTGAFKFLTLGTGLTITDTTINVAGIVVEEFYLPETPNDTIARIGTMEFQGVAPNNVLITENLYWDGADFRYRATGPGALIHMVNGVMYLRYAESGVAGNIAGSAATLPTWLILDGDGKATFKGDVEVEGDLTIPDADKGDIEIVAGAWLLDTAIKNFLRARANHTGTQTASTISDFAAAALAAAPAETAATIEALLSAQAFKNPLALADEIGILDSADSTNLKRTNLTVLQTLLVSAAHLAAVISGVANKASLVNADVFAILDSAGGGALKYVTWNTIIDAVTAGGVADDSITNAKLANMPASTFKMRVTGSTGDPEDGTAAQARTALNVANGATANDADANLRARASHTGTQLASTISDFASAALAAAPAETAVSIEALLLAQGFKNPVALADEIGILDSADSANLKRTNLSVLQTAIVTSAHIAALISATNKATLANLDNFAIVDSADGILKYVTWNTVKDSIGAMTHPQTMTRSSSGLVLNLTTDRVQAILGGAVTTAQLQCVANWRDITTTTYTPGRTLINTNNTTDVDIVGAPGASTQRVIDHINIYNNDTVPATVTVKFDANGTEYILWKGTLSVGQTLTYTEGNGWSRS